MDMPRAMRFVSTNIKVCSRDLCYQQEGAVRERPLPPVNEALNCSGCVNDLVASLRALAVGPGAYALLSYPRVPFGSNIGIGGLLRMRTKDETFKLPRVTPDHNDCWYVVQCKPLKEAYAATVLRDNMGLVTYLPQVTHRSRGKARPVVFFP